MNELIKIEERLSSLQIAEITGKSMMTNGNNTENISPMSFNDTKSPTKPTTLDTILILI